MLKLNWITALLLACHKPPSKPKHSLNFEEILTKVLTAAAAKSLQSCATLCDPIDGSPPGFPVPGILQARTLEWVAISSNARKWKVKVKLLNCVWLFATPWTATCQAPLPMGFSRQEYWSGVPLSSPKVLTTDWQRAVHFSFIQSEHLVAVQ